LRAKRQPLISAAVLVPAVVIVFLVGAPAIAAGIAILAALAGFETAQLVRRAGLPASSALAVITPPLAVLAFLRLAALHADILSYSYDWEYVAPAVALWLMAIAILALRGADPRSAFLALAGSLFAGLYPSLLGFAVVVSGLGHTQVPAHNLADTFGAGRLWLAVLVLTVWSLDSAAYIVGRSFPRGRFMNHISPNKTWSGAIGGTIVAVAVGAVLAAALLAVDPLIGAVTGLLIAVAAQAGDLVESMLKRAAGVKDSGTLIPGHGGILDRIDSFLFAAPAAYVWLLVLVHNGQAVW
jgi:phosphatidate cytidylyltransferase